MAADPFQTVQWMDEITALADDLDMREQDVATARSIRDQAIVKYARQGMARKDIAAAARISRNSVQVILARAGL